MDHQALRDRQERMANLATTAFEVNKAKQVVMAKPDQRVHPVMMAVLAHQWKDRQANQAILERMVVLVNRVTKAHLANLVLMASLAMLAMLELQAVKARRVVTVNRAPRGHQDHLDPAITVHHHDLHPATKWMKNKPLWAEICNFCRSVAEASKALPF